MCVPLFFMISGYLLFTKKEIPVFSFYRKRLFRILFPFFILCVIYFFIRNDSITLFITKIFQKKIEFHLWYVYAIVGLYLAVPFFKKLFDSEDGILLIKIYIVIWIISAIVYPTIYRYFKLEIPFFNNFNFNFFYGYMGYFLLGGLLRNHTFAKKERIFAFIITIISTWLIYYFTKKYSYSLNKPNQLFFGNLSPFVFTQAVSFFIALKDSSFKHGLIQKISTHSYWIYLIHVIVYRNILHIGSSSLVPYAWLKIPTYAFATFILCFLISIPLYRLEQRAATYIRRYIDV